MLPTENDMKKELRSLSPTIEQFHQRFLPYRGHYGRFLNCLRIGHLDQKLDFQFYLPTPVEGNGVEVEFNHQWPMTSSITSM